MKRLLAAVLACWTFAALADVEPMQVLPQGTVTISCTGSSGATALARPDQVNRKQVEISNAGTVPIFVEFGSSSVTAAVASGYPILANQTKVVTIQSSYTSVACITAGTTATLYATVGIGQ